ncbi:MAG: cbb3-type cytochrome c oxidase N-terminal domain-containing protein [Ignavibacteria bacterium]|nr:cbb3-type cytochrome c oxidase N-terminal domain-containing protein [Ignavibacteria bacterium]
MLIKKKIKESTKVKKHFELNFKLIFTILFLFPFVPIFAQGGEIDMVAYTDTAFLILFLFMIFLTIVFMVYHVGIQKIPGEVSLWAKFMDLLIDAKPIENEKEILLDHDYDGIKELNNNLPPWWKYLFYITIVWSIIYMLVFHVFDIGKLMEAEYAEEIELAELQKAQFLAGGEFIDENNVKVSMDPGTLFSGKEIFVKYCAACHGNFGEGLVGPNFTDEYWIHGGDIKNLFLIIKNGVPEKGMISWKSQLNPKNMQEVGSYILSLQGTNPPNQKPPQGEKWVVPADTAAVTQ